MTLRLVPDLPQDDDDEDLPGLPERDVRVCVFGDSFSQGVGDPDGRGWTGRVVKAAAEAGLPITMYALGVRRETSVDVARRWRAELSPRRTADTRVVLAVGANDTTMEDQVRRVSGVTSVRTLARMLDDLQAEGIPVFVVGPAPLGDPDQRDRILVLSSSYADACNARDVPYADIASALITEDGWFRELEEGDGAHPAASGYALLAELVLASGFLSFVR